MQTVWTQIRPDSVRPDLDPNCLTLMVFRSHFFVVEKVNFKKSASDKKECKFPSMLGVIVHLELWWQMLRTNEIHHAKTA